MCASGFRQSCFTDDVANARKGQNGGAHDAGENALLARQRKMSGVWLGTTGDVRRIWHRCHACEGRGWTIPPEPPPTATPREYPSIDEMLQVRMREFFESQGIQFVDITDQVVDRSPPDGGCRD
jgi:hypothetical protein